MPPEPGERQASDLLIAIGAVATNWASLEHEVNRQIWALASMSDEDGACVTAQIPNILSRMRALIALAHRNGAGDALLKDLNKFSAAVDGLSRRRNRVVHDPWFVTNKDMSQFGRLEITADRRLVFEMRPQSAAEVAEIAQAISRATKDFSALRKRLGKVMAERLKAQIGEHHGKGSADFLDQLNPDSEPE